MKELRRIISMLLILVLFIGILPMNLGVVKAEVELDETNKIKDIRARVYDGNKWEEVRLTAVVYIEGEGQKEFITEFNSDIKNYKLYLDPKYEKIQFSIKKNSDEQELKAICNGDIYKIDANDNGDIVTIRPGTSVLSVTVNKDAYSEYRVSINKPGVGNIHKLSVTSGSAEFYEAYEGDIVIISADGSYKKVFDRWVIEEDDNIIELEQGNDIIKEPDKNPTELRMPNHKLTVKPIFKESVVSDSNLRNIILYGLEDEVWKNQKSKLVFNKEQKTYSVDLSDDYSEAYVYFQFGESKQTISATLNDKAIVLVEESNVFKNGDKTEKLELNDGKNIFKIIVKSEDKQNTSIYTLIVNRGEVKYKVRFDANDGSGEMSDIEIEKGKDFELPECDFTAPYGQEFKAWEVNGEEHPAKTKIKINKETIVKAVWKDIEYKITFDKTEGSGEMDEQVVKAGKEFTLPENDFTAPENKEFAGWKIGEDVKKPGDILIINKDTEIKAIWKDIMVSVSLVPGEGTGETIVKEFVKGSTYELPDCPFTAPDGQVFKAWEVVGEEKAVGDVITINEDTEITATWRDKAIKIVKVTLVANNGTDDTKVVEKEKGTEYVLPTCDFTAPDGQVFKAWKIADKEYKPQESIKIDEATIIKAIWQDKLDPDKPNQKHAINITPSPYGEVIIDPSEAKAGDKVTVRAIANYGYELVGLSVRDASGKLLPINKGQFIMPDGEVSISSIFREIAPYIEPEIDDKAEREEQKKRHRRNYYHEEKKDEDEVKTIDKDKEEKQKESKVLITIGSEMLDKVDNGVRTLKAMDTKPYIKGGRTMLPLRYVAEALGYKVAWLSETRTAVIMDIGLRVEIPVDSNFIIVNGVKYTSDVKPEMRKNRIMLPIANIARALGLKDGKDILWDEANRQVTLIRNFNTK